MNRHSPIYRVSEAETEADLRAAQHLRYRVFVEEMGGDGAMVDHAQKLECDAFDAHARHLVLRDSTDPEGHVLGTYRMLTPEGAAAAGGYYSAGEFDLSPLLTEGHRVLELGRSCVDAAHRGGFALPALWSALSEIAEAERIDLVLGVASFPGTDLDRLAAPLALLTERHLAPEHLRPRAIGPQARAVPALDPEGIDRVVAMAQVPALIKGYLRQGALLGEGVYLDEVFNTVDVCLVLPVAQRVLRGAAARRRAARA